MIAIDVGMFQNIEQQQKLILTHEMQQSLKILQMPIVELEREVANELAENPLLETIEENIEQEHNDYYEKDTDFRSDRFAEEKETADYNDTAIEPLNYVIQKSTLRQYLAEQITYLQEDESILSICNYIIYNIDEKGYLAYSIDEIADDLKASFDKVEYALQLVQNFQPTGIAARDLKECLKIQLRNKNIKDAEIYKLIDEHLELIADNKVREISKKLKIDIKKAQYYCDFVKTLEPKPSRGFYTGELENFAIPEAYIKKIGNDFYILMNENVLPRLTVNYHYKDLLKKLENEEASEYINDKLNSAVYLIKGIESRNKTIYNILEIIIDIQRKYFEAGEQYLEPMIISDIASRLGLHESTISRAIKDKCIGTPYGTIKIKKLFTASIESSLSDENISINNIKKEIKNLIDGEEKSKPLSDQGICTALSSKKIVISRRTVAKYREEMGIGSSSRRRVYQ